MHWTFLLLIGRVLASGMSAGMVYRSSSNSCWMWA